jgi:hypothetical protein
MDSRLDDTDDLITSIEGSEDEEFINKVPKVRVG